MTEKIVASVIVLIGVLFIANGLVAFNKGEINVYIGRRRRTLVTFTGTIGDVLAVLSTLGGTLSLVGGAAYLMNALSFTVTVTTAIASLILFQLTAFVASLFQ